LMLCWVGLEVVDVVDAAQLSNIALSFCNHVIRFINDGSFSLLLKQFGSCFLQD
jgi:hypothetical protein